MTANGFLRRLAQSVYVVASVPDSLELRCEALRLVVPEDTFVCDRTAAWLHAGDRALAPNEHLSIPPLSAFRPSEHGRLRNDLTASGDFQVTAGIRIDGKPSLALLDELRAAHAELGGSAR